ncbi:MAG: hypothetical protein WBA34_04360, partial [Candidatus Deferrimicrobiaceae bacterium]
MNRQPVEAGMVPDFFPQPVVCGDPPHDGHMVASFDRGGMNNFVGQNIHRRFLKSGHDIRNLLQVIVRVDLDISPHRSFKAAETKIEHRFIQ